MNFWTQVPFPLEIKGNPMQLFHNYFILFFMLQGTWCFSAEPTEQIPGHAHNDYVHRQPLHDALALGYRSVEVDIFLKDGGRLLVGHSSPHARPLTPGALLS